VSLAGFLACWQFAVWAFHLPSYLVPAPSALIQVIFHDGRLLGHHLIATLEEALAGLGLAIAIGLGIATLMNTSRILRELLYPHMVLAQAIPLIAVAPIVLIWFGMGMLAKVLIVAFVCFFPITVNIYEGFQMVNRDFVDLLLTFGASRWQRYRHLYIPATLPSMFTGVKIAATYSVLGAVVGEWLGGISGIGIYMTRALQSFRTDKLFAAILVIMVISVLVFKSFDWLGNKLTPWIERRSDV
jgi:ABC-type nitrate/sulfonate/bicarbonate transport system permease component